MKKKMVMALFCATVAGIALAPERAEACQPDMSLTKAHCIQSCGNCLIGKAACLGACDAMGGICESGTKWCRFTKSCVSVADFATVCKKPPTPKRGEYCPFTGTVTDNCPEGCPKGYTMTDDKSRCEKWCATADNGECGLGAMLTPEKACEPCCPSGTVMLEVEGAQKCVPEIEIILQELESLREACTPPATVVQEDKNIFAIGAAGLGLLLIVILLALVLRNQRREKTTNNPPKKGEGRPS